MTVSAAAPSSARAAAVDRAQLLAHGAITYVTFCAVCHGAIGEGDRARGAPTLAGRQAADLQRQISELKVSPMAYAHHSGVLGQLRDEDLSSVAAYLAELAPPPPGG